MTKKKKSSLPPGHIYPLAQERFLERLTARLHQGKVVPWMEIREVILGCPPNLQELFETEIRVAMTLATAPLPSEDVVRRVIERSKDVLEARRRRQRKPRK